MDDKNDSKKTNYGHSINETNEDEAFQDFDNNLARDLVDNILLTSDFESRLSFEEEKRIEAFASYQQKYAQSNDYESTVEESVAMEFCKMKRMMLEDWLMSPFFSCLEKYIPNGENLKQYAEQDTDVINL